MIFLALFGMGSEPPRGEIIFKNRCSVCHYKGNTLVPPAPLFEDYRIKPEYVVYILENGVEGTSMRAFKDLTSEEKREVAYYVSSLSGGSKVFIEDSLISRGRYIYESVCSTCHGINGDGKGLGKLMPPPPDFRKFNPLPKRTIEVLNHGIKGSNMYSFGEILSDRDKRAVAYYILMFYEEGR